MFDSSVLNILEVRVSQKYQVRLIMHNGTVSVESRENGNGSLWTGALKGLNAKCLSWPTGMLGRIGRFLFVNPKTLEVVYCRGLLGGGSSPSKNIKAPMNDTELSSYEDIVPSKLEDNQQKAIKLAIKVAAAIEYSTFEIKVLKNLEAISPYECTNPYAIAKILFSKFNNDICWSSPIYSDHRAIVARITRKHLFVHFMRNPNRVIFSNPEKQSIISNLKDAIDKVKQNLKLKPEMSTLLDLNVMLRLINRANDTQRWWIQAIEVSKELYIIAKSIKSLDPIPLLDGLYSLFDIIYRRSRGSYAEFLIILDVYERYALSADPSHSSKIEKFLSKQFKKQNELSWEEIHILLSFLETCIQNGKVSVKFLKKFSKYFTKLIINKNWEIREKCANLLRVLRSHTSSEIKLIFEKSYLEALKNEGEEKVKITLRLPPHKKLDEITKSSSLNNLRCVSDHIIGRENEIQEIELHLNIKNRLAICGLPGFGKSMLALQYCKQQSHKFDIIWQIDSQSINSNLSLLAEELGFKENGDRINKLFTQLKSNIINKKIIFLFDNIEVKRIWIAITSIILVSSTSLLQEACLGIISCILSHYRSILL